MVIGNLPASVAPASVRVAARGLDLALLNVEVHGGYRTDPLREEAARLRSEVDRCRDALQALDDEDAAEQARLDFLGHLSETAATALARGGVWPRRPQRPRQDGRSSVCRYRGRSAAAGNQRA